MWAKIARDLPKKDVKIDIIVQDGKHESKDEIDRQVNDKERYLAALEKEEVAAIIEDLIREEY